MRILIAPDKFKGTLSARDAAEAIAAGATRAASERGLALDCDLCPVADGGEGFLDCVQRALLIDTRRVTVTGPLGEPVEARIAWDAPGATAYLEASDAMGARHVPPERKNPERTTTRGVGELIAAALDLGARRIVVGLGGSSTVDGAIGAAGALGVGFLDESGHPIEPVASRLGDVRRIVPLPVGHPLRAVGLVTLCDVSNPLLGLRGAGRVYAPQKGATPEQVERLEAGLANLVQACRDSGILCDPDHPGAGSAGGLGFGLATFLGARLTAGAPYILDLLDFDAHLQRAELVITGEGRLDAQTASGKAAAEVAQRAEAARRPCLAVAGSTEGAPQEVRGALSGAGVRYALIASAEQVAGSGERALSDARAWTQAAAYDAVRRWLAGDSGDSGSSGGSGGC